MLPPDGIRSEYCVEKAGSGESRSFIGDGTDFAELEEIFITMESSPDFGA